MSYITVILRLIFCMLYLHCSAKDQEGNRLARLLNLPKKIIGHYGQASDCICSNSTLYVNSTDSRESLTPTNSAYFCKNMSCSWTIFMDYNTSDDLIAINFQYSDYETNNNIVNMIKMTNCKNNISYNSPGAHYFFTQETEICVAFNSYGLMRDISTEWWGMNFGYTPNGINYPKIILDENLPITSFTILSEDLFSITYAIIIAETTYGTIELGAVMPDTTSNCNRAMGIYFAENLTNYQGKHPIPCQNYTQIASQSRFLTISIEDSSGSELDYNWETYQFIYRSKELHPANCNTTENLRYAYPWDKSNKFSIAATSKGKCLFSIVPSSSQYSRVILEENFGEKGRRYYFIHILHIISLNYEGPGNVAVVSGCNETYKLFDFSNKTYSLWDDTVVYGELISFIIPPDGKLYIEYENLNLINKCNEFFDNYGTGIIQSPTYPLRTYGQNFRQTIQGQNLNGHSSVNITIVFAEITYGGHLLIFSEDKLVINLENGNLIEGTTYSFNATKIIIDYDQGNDHSRGALIRYEGKFVPFIEPTSGSLKGVTVWIIVGSSLLLVLLIAAFLIFIYRYQINKERRRMDFIIDLIKAQKQLSPEEIEDLKEKRDEFTISKKKLRIYYEMPIGHGTSSTVYIGFIYGKSPLTLSTNLIGTQRFQDCKVAVKVPSTFGSDESEQLFREIDSMKKIGYHQNIICMLGACFLDEKPVIAFELADKDLLEYVKSLKEANLENTYFSPKVFFSILWQIAKGMQFIASKLIVHRDLAARNILLTDSFNAKISDFGLSCYMENSDLGQKNLSKKLPIKWLSIEALLSKLFSEKSDVWAFGVLMHEVFSFGLVPYPGFVLKDLVDYLKAGNRLHCPEASDEQIYEIILGCWKEDPEERPTFEILANRFYAILLDATKSYGYVESKKDA